MVGTRGCSGHHVWWQENDDDDDDDDDGDCRISVVCVALCAAACC